TSRHWLIEVPIRIVAYIAVALVFRYIAHRMIDQMTAARSRKDRGAADDTRPSRTPPIVRRLRDRVPSSATSEQVIARRQQRAQTIGSVL
ncbi:hypothetical protein NL436_27265, partial [Klebsiella pneumoniae]|nr:hypothetical protein [Klebsiella pneumoniae]